MRKIAIARALYAVVATMLVAGTSARAQNEPFTVYDTKPVITHGPFLVDMSETAVTVMWTTDTPSHSEVRFGAGDALDQRAEAPVRGLLPVGTVHTIRITGLMPGRTYQYRAVSTRVVKVKAYWPDKGLAVESATYAFTTFDRAKPAIAFSVVTDTHESVPRIDSLMRAIDWSATDFLVHTGDAFDWVDNEDQVFAKWLDPVGKGLAHVKPLVYARGNHDLRGAFARALFDYVPVEEGRFYTARDVGPVHLLILDTGEDKPDSTNVYARMNRSEPYLASELQWLVDHAKNTPRVATAPFRVAVMHQPNWGSMPDGTAKWRAAASAAGLDLVIAGHTHRFRRIDAGTDGATFTTLILGQGQLARVVASTNEIAVVVQSSLGVRVDSFSVLRRR
jgi:predicted phosphodiesterase